MSDNDFLSRRLILQGAMMTGASALAAGCGDDPPAMTGPDPDIAPLNALLRAEYIAIKAYEAGLTVFNMPPAGDPQAGLMLALIPLATNWKRQHTEHAAALSVNIRAIGGTPIDAASVSFSLPSNFVISIRNTLALACNAEKAAAIAYNNAVKTLASTGNRFLAGNIEGDETQHFMVLYALLKQLVAPVPAVLITNLDNIVQIGRASCRERV